jgi:hypothetical protein
MTERLVVQEKLSGKDRSGSEPSEEPSNHSDDDGSRSIPNGVLAMILVILAVVLVLGYLFVNKMADISHQEDCALAHRNNC